MTYHLPSQRDEPLGASLDSIVRQGSRLLSGVSPTFKAASQVMTDPAFPELTCHILRLSNIEHGKPAGVCKKGPRRPGGVGLRYVILPVKLLIFHRKYPWALPAMAAALIGGTYLLGFSNGRRRK